MEPPHPHSSAYHAISVEETLHTLNTTPKGLSQQEAQQRLQQYGLNELTSEEKISPFKIFLEQFTSPIVWVLIAAVIISAAIGEYIDAVVIGIILVANAVIGFFQEFKAEKAIEALKKMASLKAVVLRDGNEVKIDAKDIVPGDIVLLETGEKIPADARLLNITALQTQEAVLTGESVPVNKKIEPVKQDAMLGDRKNMVFSGTTVTNGKATAVIVSTGMKTEIGKIAHMISKQKPEPTPLQKSLKVLGKWLGIFTLIICVVVFLTGILKGEPILQFFIVAVSLAVAAIPEGLPAVVTIALALGVQKMVKKNALIRKLPSVETLGCTTVICSDKTGTLTHNQMTVRKIFVDNEIIEVSGVGYKPEGKFSKMTRDLPLLLQIGALNNDARLNGTEDEIFGDPTEGALLVSALKGKVDKKILKMKYPRKKEFPFTSERKRMTTIHNIEGVKTVFVKGAVDVILKQCSYIILQGKKLKLTEDQRQMILETNEKFASEALRVLGFAYRGVDNIASATPANTEKDLIFVGMQAMIDPPREEVKDAIKRCKDAGIKVMMITGDHKTTAVAIAKELGIEGRAVTGADLATLHLTEQVEQIGVFARVNPAHKLSIVNALKTKGHVVAMTGDGVNDAPALKKADIGIAMGISGTDVAKEASEMILTDDNFASIVNAVEEGRVIYDNIRKFVTYLLSSNIGEVLTIFIAILIGLRLPLLAIMILWINLVTDGFPALALGVDPAEPGIMAKKPRDPHAKIVDKRKGLYMFCIGLIMMLGTLGLFHLWEGKGYEYATTMAFCVLMMYQMFNVLNCRSDDYSLFKVGLFNNTKLVWAILSSFALQLIVIYTPLNIVFKTVPIGLMEWVWIIVVSSSVLWFGELWKLVAHLLHERQKSTPIQ